MLPSLFLLGCMKCATTLLHKQLAKTCSKHLTEGTRQQGETWFAFKEKHYFDRNSSYEKGPRFYSSHYPLCRAAKTRGKRLVGLDSTQGSLSGVVSSETLPESMPATRDADAARST